jgi:hypothetical protein
MSLISFIEHAPCKDAEPVMFDQHQIELAQPALNICKGCAYWDNCNSLLEPQKNFYDGVAAGKLWRNGRILAKLLPEAPHRLIVGEELIVTSEEALEFRGGELLGD